MARTRIRWQNVGRLAGGVAVGAVALFAGADLLEPPPPEPLPADVGLATGASGVHGYAPPATEPHERGEREAPAERERPRRVPEAAPSQRTSTTNNNESVRESDPKPARQAQKPPPSPAGAAPAPVTPTPPAPPPPAPAPEPPAPPPNNPEPGNVQAEFGFEPRP